MKTLNGLWMVVHAEMSGNDITSAFGNELMEIAESTYKIYSGEKLSDAGLLTWHEHSNKLDIRGAEGPNKDKLFQCIYKTEGENLIICYSQINRPEDFATSSENQFVLIIWKRK